MTLLIKYQKNAGFLSEFIIIKKGGIVMMEKHFTLTNGLEGIIYPSGLIEIEEEGLLWEEETEFFQFLHWEGLEIEEIWEE